MDSVWVQAHRMQWECWCKHIVDGAARMQKVRGVGIRVLGCGCTRTVGRRCLWSC